MSGDIHAEARQRYERAAAYLRHGLMNLSEMARLRGLPQAFQDRLAEEQDRREWIDGVRRRLGLVAEVHRCRVLRFGWQDWGWHCLRPGCRACSKRAYPHAEAFAAALAHARSFIPKPPEPEGPLTELEQAVFNALFDGVRDDEEALIAALPCRMAAVAKEINAAFAPLLPDGTRFEWVAGGELRAGPVAARGCHRAHGSRAAGLPAHRRAMVEARERPGRRRPA